MTSLSFVTLLGLVAGDQGFVSSKETFARDCFVPKQMLTACLEQWKIQACDSRETRPIGLKKGWRLNDTRDSSVGGIEPGTCIREMRFRVEMTGPNMICTFHRASGRAAPQPAEVSLSEEREFRHLYE